MSATFFAPFPAPFRTDKSPNAFPIPTHTPSSKDTPTNLAVEKKNVRLAGTPLPGAQRPTRFGDSSSLRRRNVLTILPQDSQKGTLS
jgi:hypothetical protein